MRVLTDRQLDELESLLELKAARCTAAIQLLRGAYTAPGSGCRELSAGRQAELERERLAAEAALARISAGIFGKCCGCGEQIAAECLRERPAHAFCSNCKSAADYESERKNGSKANH